MIRISALTLVALTFLVSCASQHGPYLPVTRAEKTELAADRPDIYPDDVRKDLDHYTNTAVAWAGIIRSTDAREEDIGGKIRATTILTQHYFDWVQDKKGCHLRLMVSPRGEGPFRIDWHLIKKDTDATAEKAEKFAGKGKLAIVYGVPKKIDDDGTIVLEYRYLRVFDRHEFTTNDVVYGRLGEAFRPDHPGGSR